jgi:hypothetical protein
MSNGHGSSRRQAYGRRMKELRSRRETDLEVDLEGPGSWSRGGAWESDHRLPRLSSRLDQGASQARSN